MANTAMEIFIKVLNN